MVVVALFRKSAVFGKGFLGVPFPDGLRWRLICCSVILLIIQEPTCDTTACLVFSFGHWNALAPCAVVWSCSDTAGRGLLIVGGFNVVCKGSRHSRKKKISDTFSPSDFLEHEQNETSVFVWTLIAASAFVLRIPRVNGCSEIAALYIWCQKVISHIIFIYAFSVSQNFISAKFWKTCSASGFCLKLSCWSFFGNMFLVLISWQDETELRSPNG